MPQHNHVTYRESARLDTMQGDRYRRAYYLTHEHPMGRNDRRNCRAGIIKSLAFERSQEAAVRDLTSRVDRAIRAANAAANIRLVTKMQATRVERMEARLRRKARGEQEYTP